MSGKVEVDEFVAGSKEKGKIGRSYDAKKKKAVCAVEYSDMGGITRMYIQKIADYSSKSLERIFNKHISTTAQVTTDKWKGYRPLQEDYDIEQIESNGGQSFPSITYYDTSSKIMDTNYLLMGK